MHLKLTQQNYKRLSAAIALVVLGAALGLAFSNPAMSGTIAKPTPPDPILDGGPPGPCNPGREGANFVAGTDVNGNPVVPATVGARPVPVPEGVLMPLGRQGGQVALSGAQIAGLLHTPPACPGHRTDRSRRVPVR